MKPLLFFDLDDTLVDHHAAEEGAHRETHAAHAPSSAAVPFETWLAAYRKNNLALWERYGRGEIDRPTLSTHRFADPLGDLGLDAAARRRASATSTWARTGGTGPSSKAPRRSSSTRRARASSESSRTGSARRSAAKIARFGLDRWVRHVILSEDVGAMKPSRVIFDAAWKAAGGGPGRRVYVGDSFATDVLGAKAAGWFPIWFDRHARGAPQPVVYVRRLVDLLPLLA